MDLGRRLHHDPESRRYASPLKAPVPRQSVRHRLDAEHVDQFYLGACVGFSGTNWLNTRAAYRSRRAFNAKVPIGKGRSSYLGNDDGIRNYHEATLRDPFPGEYPPTDDGSSAIGLMKWWAELGVIKRYDWTFSFDAFLAELQRQPVLIGSYWFDDMMSTDRHGLVTSSCDMSSHPGGHEYLANAIIWHDDPAKRLIGYEQSWGEHPKGFAPTFFMSWELAEHLIIDLQGDVCVPRSL